MVRQDLCGSGVTRVPGCSAKIGAIRVEGRRRGRADDENRTFLLGAAARTTTRVSFITFVAFFSSLFFLLSLISFFTFIFAAAQRQ